jgi:hypothetical protein
MVFVIVNMAVEGGTEAVDEAHRTEEAGLGIAAAASAQMGLDDAQQDIPLSSEISSQKSGAMR